MKNANVVVPLHDGGGADLLRLALKQALEAEAAAREAAEQHRLGVSRAWRHARSAKQAIADAEAEVAKAAEEHVEALADAAAADAPAPAPTAVRRAREGVEDAAASEHAAQLAWAKMKAEAPAYEAAAKAASFAVDSAVASVLAPNMAELVEQARMLIDELEPIARVLRGLALDGQLGPSASPEESIAKVRAQRPLDEIRRIGIEQLNRAVGLASTKGDERELIQEARRRLRADPAAELPEELRA